MQNIGYIGNTKEKKKGTKTTTINKSQQTDPFPYTGKVKCF